MARLEAFLMLAFPDFTKLFSFSTDVSEYYVQVPMLFQEGDGEERPAAYN